MQQQLPARIQPVSSTALESQVVHSTMPAPEGGFPNFDDYSVVTMQLREATITASKDPMTSQFQGQGVVNTYPAIPAIPQINVQTAPQFGYGAPQQTHNNPVQEPIKRKRLFGQDAALWICVAQLGVIIWLLYSAAEHTRQGGEIKQALLVGSNNIGSFFNSAMMSPMNPLQFGKPKKASAINQATHGKPKKKHAARKVAYQGMVPPPPPEMTTTPGKMGKMMVPPPPVAFAFPPSGSGAVAASTLPAAGDDAVIIEVKPKAPKAKRAEEPQPAATAPTPVAQEAPAPVVAEANEPAITQSKAHTWQEYMNSPAPVQAEQVEPQQQAPGPSFRTVMAGKRQRIITDR